MKLVSGEAEIEIDKHEEKNFKKFNIKIKGDIPPADKIPSTIPEVNSYIISLPAELKKKNDGKGVAVYYVLIPIEQVIDQK
jgi:hypothetical protein